MDIYYILLTIGDDKYWLKSVEQINNVKCTIWTPKIEKGKRFDVESQAKQIINEHFANRPNVKVDAVFDIYSAYYYEL